MTPHLLRIVDSEPIVRKRVRPPKSYKAWLKAKGVKPLRIERTPKRAGEYEFDHNGKLVPCVSEEVRAA